MNKNYIFAIVVIAVLFPYNQASAGLFDWITSRSPASIATTVVDGEDLPFEQLYSAIVNDDDSPTQTTAISRNAAAPVSKVAPTPVKKATNRIYVVSASAYSSTVDQTDDSPFITAWNTYVRDGIVATNFLPFGTRIKIPEVFGNKIFVVEDRMNKRYKYNVDVWFPDRESAKQFGRKSVTIEVIPL